MKKITKIIFFSVWIVAPFLLWQKYVNKEIVPEATLLYDCHEFSMHSTNSLDTTFFKWKNGNTELIAKRTEKVPQYY